MGCVIINILQDNKFWKFAEIKTIKENLPTSIRWLALAYAVMAVALFMYVNLPDTRIASSVFVFMALAAGIIIALGEMSYGRVGYNYNFMGKKGVWKVAGFAGGLVAFGLIYFGGQSIVPVLSVVPLDSFWTELFLTGIAAPVFEELFFRLPIFFIFPFLLSGIGLSKNFGNVVGIVGSSLAWALFHVNVYGANPSLLGIIFVIGVVYVVGNQYIFRSSAFSFVAHLVNNVLIVLISYGVFSLG